MISQAPLNFPDPGSTEPRRPTPVLVGAGIVAVLAILIIGIVLFTGGGPSPTHAPSPTPSSSSPGASSTPRPSATPPGSGEPSPTPSIAPGAIEELAAEICAAPVPPYDALHQSLLSGFGEYCEEAVATVITDESIDISRIEAAGWAFTAATGDVEGRVNVSRVFIDLTGERRIRRYTVNHDASGGATIDGDRTQVRRISDPLLIFSWSAP